MKIEDITQQQLDRIISVLKIYANRNFWEVIESGPCEYELDGKLIKDKYEISQWSGGYGPGCSTHGSKLAQGVLNYLGE